MIELTQDFFGYTVGRENEKHHLALSFIFFFAEHILYKMLWIYSNYILLAKHCQDSVGPLTELNSVVLMSMWLSVEAIAGYIALGIYLLRKIIEYTCGERLQR